MIILVELTILLIPNNSITIEKYTINSYIEYINYFNQIKGIIMTETTRILEEIFDKGYATKTIDIIEGKIKATISTLSAKDQLEIEEYMNKDRVKNNPAAYVVHLYSLKLLSKTLKSYGNKTFANSDEAYEFLGNLVGSIVDKLTKAQNALEKDVRKALNSETIEENFSNPGSSSEN